MLRPERSSNREDTPMEDEEEEAGGGLEMEPAEVGSEKGSNSEEG